MPASPIKIRVVRSVFICLLLDLTWTQHLLDLQKGAFKLLYALIFEFRLFAEGVDDLVQALDVLLVLNLLLAHHAQLVH